jgi:hypothetical protein
MQKYAATLTILTMLLTLTLLAGVHSTNAQTEDPKKFEQYRAAIKQEYGIDIKDFKGNLHGGRADGKGITKYDLQQLLMGIGVEQEHMKDKMTALEISMDHLEEFPDYYTRLKKMEEEADHDKESKDRVK